MKTPTNSLFQLVQSMTAAEKRYFKIHFSSNKSLVTKLFDFINSMQSYDEELVKEHFRSSKLSKNLKVYKIMLIDLLLKSLSSFRYKKNLNSNIRQSIDEVEILIEKKLYSQAYKKLMRIKDICENYEEFNDLLTILDLEFQLTVFHGLPFLSGANKKDILSKASIISNKVKSINELRQLNYQLSLIANQLIFKKADEEELKEYENVLFKHEVTLTSNDNAPSFKANYYLNSAFSHLYHCSKNIKEEYTYKKRCLDLFDDYPHFTENNPEQYWAAYYNLINCCSRAGKEKEMLKNIEALKKFTEKYPELHRKRILISLVEINNKYQKNEFQYIEDHLETLALEHIKASDNEQGRGVTRTHLALSLVALAKGDQTKVQFYLRRLFESSKKMNDSFSYFFEMVNFISHYEAKDFDILRNLLVSKKRKLKRDNSFGTPFFKALIEFFSSLIEKEADTSALAKNFKQGFHKYKNDGLYVLMKHFVLDTWISALESGHTYAEQILLKDALLSK